MTMLKPIKTPLQTKRPWDDEEWRFFATMVVGAHPAFPKRTVLKYTYSFCAVRMEHKFDARRKYSKNVIAGAIRLWPKAKARLGL